MVNTDARHASSTNNTPHAARFVAELHTALRKLPSKPMDLFRGVKLVEAQSISTGMQMQHLISCTSDRSVAERFARNGGVVQQIHATDAIEISQISMNPKEKEFVVLPGTVSALQCRSDGATTSLRVEVDQLPTEAAASIAGDLTGDTSAGAGAGSGAGTATYEALSFDDGLPADIWLYAAEWLDSSSRSWLRIIGRALRGIVVGSPEWIRSLFHEAREIRNPEAADDLADWMEELEDAPSVECSFAPGKPVPEIAMQFGLQVISSVIAPAHHKLASTAPPSAPPIVVLPWSIFTIWGMANGGHLDNSDAQAQQTWDALAKQLSDSEQRVGLLGDLLAAPQILTPIHDGYASKGKSGDAPGKDLYYLGAHWSRVVFDRSQGGAFVHHDSDRKLGATLGQARVAQEVCRLVRLCCGKAQRPFKADGGAAQQANNFDCGLHVLYHALLLCSGADFAYTPAAMTELRTQLHNRARVIPPSLPLPAPSASPRFPCPPLPIASLPIASHRFAPHRSPPLCSVPLHSPAAAGTLTYAGVPGQARWG